MSTSSLALFPEELLERILADTVVAPAAPHPRAPWHPSPSASSGKETRGRTAPLLVSRAFHRIAVPLFHHTLVLHSPRQSQALLAALRARPHLARSVRVLVLPTPSASDAEVLGMLPGLTVLDVTLPPNGTPSECDGMEAVCNAIRQLRGLRELSVRKAAGTYLSQPAPRAMLDALADVVSNCAELHSTHLTFPLSSDPALASLTGALSAAPALKSLRTPLPSLPGAAAAYVEVARNATLEKVCLGDDVPASPTSYTSPLPAERTPLSKDAKAPAPAQPRALPERRATYTPSPSYRQPRALLPTGLFLSAARPHARLTELIRAGTPIASSGNGSGWRGRAATVGSY
ncbi:hypothetical protein MVEN_00243000 [Mycena venus]|uniref:Uncharacterized protein n=1 Tax=Mycena venus TaxID=2733690 RepID=A0A8H6YZ37_9AGAR|nr:hypothetical protein MVEN_00243000 [Mycena venus]